MTKKQKKGKYHPGNSLNNLTGKDWLKFTKTWFVYDGPQRSKEEILHPAKYPEGMIVDFIKYFTKEGETVFDPFLGSGQVAVVSKSLKRRFLGFEIVPDYYKFAKKRLDKDMYRIKKSK